MPAAENSLATSLLPVAMEPVRPTEIIACALFERLRPPIHRVRSSPPVSRRTRVRNPVRPGEAAFPIPLEPDARVVLLFPEKRFPKVHKLCRQQVRPVSSTECLLPAA